MARQVEPPPLSESGRILRFLCVGAAAALVHFAVMATLVEAVGMRPVALAATFAAIAGVSASFVGNRHFVFSPAPAPWCTQAWRFTLLYTGTSLLHAAVLYLWTDLGGQDYRLGFLLATSLQAVLSYIGNRTLVFARRD